MKKQSEHWSSRHAGLKSTGGSPWSALTSRANVRASSCQTREPIFASRQEVDKNTARETKPRTHGEAFSDRQEVVLKVVRKALRARKNAEKSKVDLCLEMENTLREANENLVIASVNAQLMTEAIERVATHLSYMADHDLLTGLPNRALLSDRLAQSILLAKRHGSKVALMFLDIDHFKHINDSMGHAIGDQLLKSVARRLLASVRNSDTVSRHGGDEFVILLPEVEDVHSAALAADKLIRSVEAPHLVSGQEIRVSLSIGISMFPDDGEDAEVLMRNADIAMYQAKRSGRNRYKIFTARMGSSSAMLKSAEQELERAFKRGEFILHYQPIVHLGTGTITGAEVLLRWEHSSHRLKFPAQFITIAESCKLILPLGQWVIREACRQAQEWMQRGLTQVRIAVNVSAVEFSDRNFLAGVRDILEDTGLEPRFLQMEMSENSLARNPQQALPALHALKDLGVEIAVDNFGTGLASLSFLREFPIGTVKIDKSFVHSINAETGKAVFSALMAMARGFNHHVVAGGVETKAQHAFLKKHHCAEGQGYYLGQPMAAEAFSALAGERKYS